MEFLWNSGIHSGILKNWLRVWYGVSIPLIFKHWVQFYCHNWQFYKNEGIEEKNTFINEVKSKSISNFFNCVEIRIWALNLNSVVENDWNWHPISYPKSIFQNSTMNSGNSQEFQKNWNLQIQSAKLRPGTKIKWEKHPKLSNLTKYVPFRRNSTWNFQNSGKCHLDQKCTKLF